MELYQLRYFIGVAQMGSVSQAARKLNVSQPAISRAISKLEAELGTPLFERVDKRLYLNLNGKLFLDNVERALLALDQAAINASMLAAKVEGEVKVVIFGPQIRAIEMLGAFADANPQVRIALECRKLDAAEGIARVYDMVFYPDIASFSHLKGVEYGCMQRMVCLNPEHPLANSATIDLSELHDDPFVFMNASAGTFEDSSMACRDAGFAPWVRFITNSGLARNAFIRENLAVALVDEIDAAKTLPGDLRLVPLSGENHPTSLMFACRPVHLLSSPANALLSFALEFFDLQDATDTKKLFAAN